MENIAERVIHKLGGAPVVSEITGVDVSQVYRWTYPKERGGTGGLIPARHQSKILNSKKARDANLTSSDFFETKITKRKAPVGEEMRDCK